MKKIRLSSGDFAFVDDEDFEEINKYKWSVQKTRHTSYAVRTACLNGKEKTIKMHRQILCVNDKKILVDHKDHNGLNNQKCNIRKCNNSENQMNKKSVAGSSCKYVGVCWHRKDKKWQAAITINRKQKHLGQFNCPTKAALVRDLAAKKLFGDFANLNLK